MIEQGTDAWRQVRLGKVTASRVADVIAKTRTGWGASRDNYAAELIAERLTGVTQETYQSPAMMWGTECEPQARAAYCFYRDVNVTEVGFVEHLTIEMVGASPDGLAGDDGLVEIKCPNTSTHIDTLLNHAVPAKYITQMQFQMACTGRKWCDFVSFDPRMPQHMQLFVKRIERDDTVIATLEREVIAFLSEVETRLLGLEKLYGKREAA